MFVMFPYFFLFSLCSVGMFPHFGFFLKESRWCILNTLCCAVIKVQIVCRYVVYLVFDNIDRRLADAGMHFHLTIIWNCRTC